MRVCVTRYRQQLSDGLKRERALEQMQVQLEVEWQSRCEDMKAQHYLSNEQLIQDLTAARDQVSRSCRTPWVLTGRPTCSTGRSAAAKASAKGGPVNRQTCSGS